MRIIAEGHVLNGQAGAVLPIWKSAREKLHSLSGMAVGLNVRAGERIQEGSL